jgi:hypothetical protein
MADPLSHTHLVLSRWSRVTPVFSRLVLVFSCFVDQIVGEVNKEDGLVIVARGLALSHILYHTIRPHCTPSRLVFILNLSDDQLELLNERLNGDGTMLIRKITSGSSVGERQRAYLEGGCISVRSNILFEDLKARQLIPCFLINGMIVNNAEKFHKTTHDYFVVECYLSAFPKGSIKVVVTQRRYVENSCGLSYSANVYLRMGWPYFLLTVHIPYLF